MKLRYGLALAVSAALMAGGAGLASAAQPGSARQAAAASGGAATARSVNLRALAAGRQIPAHAGAVGTLGIDGRPAGADLPTRPAQGRKVVPPAPGSRPAGPNSARSARSATGARTVAGLRSAAKRRVPRTPPTTVNANFSGVSQATSNCGGCQPPDPNAAVGLTQIAEAVNLRLEVYSKTGAAQCGIGLNTFLGTASALSDPRIQYDNLYNRFSMVVTVVPPAGATPALYVLASKTASACGSWWVYRMTFFGSF
ncbi:MAG TPA: hypothetical protein VII22_15345, partial [Streptosporangiaceae bacterium]